MRSRVGFYKSSHARRRYIGALFLLIFVLTAHVIAAGYLMRAYADYSNILRLSQQQHLLLERLKGSAYISNQDLEIYNETLLEQHLSITKGDELEGIFLSSSPQAINAFYFEAPHNLDQKIKDLHGAIESLPREEKSAALPLVQDIIESIELIIRNSVDALQALQFRYLIFLAFTGFSAVASTIVIVTASSIGIFEPLLRMIHRQSESLHERETQLSHLIENLPLPVALLDQDTRFVMHSKKMAREFLGHDDHLGGHAFLQTFSFFPGIWNTHLKQVLAGGHLKKDLDTTTDRHGGQMYIRWEGIPWRENNGDISGIILFIENITKRVSLEQDQILYKNKLENLVEQRTAELKKAIKRAEKAAAVKTDFLANMSHELRTPLNSIIGMTRLIHKTPLDNEQTEMLDGIRRASDAQLNIVNNILDLSALETGHVELENIGFDFEDRVRGIVNMLQPLATDKGLVLSVNIENSPMPFVKGDPHKLTQVMQNLIANAVKYTNTGRIDVSCQHTLGSGDSVGIRFAVKDTGIGIAKDKLDDIFQKFTQGDTSTQRKYGGTGLGLTICQQLITLMGGEIGVESVQRKGSTFWFSLPLTTTPELHQDFKVNLSNAQNSMNKDLKHISQTKILVAEDYELNIMFLKRFLLSTGGPQVDFVHTGLEAIEAFKNETYDLIMMDCHMPDMGGYQATREIRKIEEESETKHPIPVIALTADAMNDNEEKCKDAGMNGFLSKPIDTDDFYLVMGQWIDFSETEQQVDENAKSDGAVDLAYLKHHMGDNSADVREFVQSFVEHSQTLLETLEKSSAEADENAWHQAAHRLHSTAGFLGAHTLSDLCEKAESKKTAEQPEKESMLSALNAAFKEVQAALKAHGYLE